MANAGKALPLQGARSACQPPVMKQGEASVITVAMDEPLQISVETDDGSSMWAACTVRSIDAGSGEFSVWVTEWADLDPEDPEYEEAYEEGPYTATEEGEEWRRQPSRVITSDDSFFLDVGDPLQIFVDTEDDAIGAVWAACTVRSVDAASGEFMVTVTEWDGLDPSDPEYEEAYEEGPYRADEEGDEWRRPAAQPPRAAVTGAKSKAVSEATAAAERAQVEAVAQACSRLKNAGFDKDDQKQWAGLNAAVEALYQTLEATAAPPIATDGRLVGDWELVGCTSRELAQRKGLTGLGAAPFTGLGALHFSFTAEGGVTAKETLAFFGRPVILNELRGAVGFSSDGLSMQEKYLEADMGGQQNSPAFREATATLAASVITSNGKLRLGRNADGILVFTKLPPGTLAAYLDETLLPISGGTYIGNPDWKGPVERVKELSLRDGETRCQTTGPLVGDEQGGAASSILRAVNTPLADAADRRDTDSEGPSPGTGVRGLVQGQHELKSEEAQTSINQGPPQR
eukprot:CAMPEP_0206159628 /NCGR_PEP_ID=MMETSP1474-20131121/6015_1 /ASSEMBLY_ACC=CAM_ASM_001110 /TAXON_ID=97495 /ORGANISM="Imantonia sp., Strain RCC918" /LENGTH=515 /DNA_ID=CAMNT_0053560465 /DNA_START=156 /DNA_END=1700 /DNA_ORIENTATION=-